MSRLGPILILAALGLIFFAPLWLHPGEILYSDHSDILALHLPAMRFLVRSVSETSELPLWCPHMFAGVPFVHDIQNGVFYPPHLLLHCVAEERVGLVLSWLIVAHVIIAGWTMYGYARSQDLGTSAALVAGVGYMFAGKWMLHLLAAGHYFVVGLAWLPLVMLCLERAIRRRSCVWATVAGLTFALLLLGTQPQWTFYAGILIALWTLAEVLHFDQRPQTRPGLILTWLTCGAWTVMVGVTLTSVQLLPTAEATEHSLRAGGIPQDHAVAGAMRSIQNFFGPALSVPVEVASTEWEDRGSFALLWVVAAVLAPVLRGGRVQYHGAVALALVVFAVGGSLLFQSLPGFRLFRLHTRMLVLVAFPLAYLAGVTTHCLLSQTHTQVLDRWGRYVLLRLGAAAGLLFVGMAIQYTGDGQTLRFHPYWVSLILTVPLAFWLLQPGRPRTTLFLCLWCGLLLLDVWSLTWPLVHVRSEAEIYPPSACVDFLKAHRGDGRILDVDDPESFCTPLGTGAPLALLERLDVVRGFNPLDVRRYKEYLQFVTDQDEPLQAMGGGPLTFPLMTGFPSKAEPLKNRELLDLLGVRLLVQPRRLAAPGEGWSAMPAPQEDTAAFEMLAGGVRTLEAPAIYRNDRVLPRAFVVTQTRELPPRAEVLAALKKTDFRKLAWLETSEVHLVEKSDPQATVEVLAGENPNRVRLRVRTTERGVVVLADPWYPGWECTVNGQTRPVFRANFLFRAVELDAGDSDVEFQFVPASYQRGRTVSLGAIVVVGLIILLGVGNAVRRGRSRVGVPASAGLGATKTA